MEKLADSLDNSEDLIDSRDVTDLIEYFEAKLESLVDDELQDFKNEYGDKLESLKKLAEEGEAAAPDWNFGETMILESYFTEHVMQTIKDCGDLPQDIPSYIEIDEEKTAENLKADYQEIDFDGETYYIR
jgi:hypothetical protein